MNSIRSSYLKEAFGLTNHCLIEICEDQNSIYEIIHCLGNTETLFGISSEQLENKDILKLISAPSGIVLKNAFNETKLSRKDIKCHASILNGPNTIPVHIKLKTLEDENKNIFWIGNIESINSESDKDKELIDLRQQIKNNDIERDFTLENLQVGIWNFNPITLELYWDKSMYKLFDIEPHNFSGHYQAWEQTLHPEDIEKATTELFKAINGIDNFDSSFRILTTSGKVKMVRAAAYIERDEKGVAIMLYGINWDHTKQDELEKERELEKIHLYQAAKLITLGEMAGGIAHEINNPLAIISGFSKMLTKETDMNKKILILDKINNASERISKVITCLKDFSRSSTINKRSNIPLVNILEDILLIKNSLIKKNKINITNEIDKEITLNIDEIAIKQLILNLLQNAIDATENVKDSQVTIATNQIKNQIQIIISDNGNGVSPENIEKIFNPFFTTRQMTTRMGLGLSIAKGIALDHKGKIEYKRINSITQFILYLPNN